MKRLLLIGGCAIGSVAAASTHPTQPQSTSACVPPDARTPEEVATVKSLVTGSDSGSIGVRQLSHLAAVADTAVAAVSDSTTCARALTAFNTAMDGGPYSQIYLVRAGIMYVATHLPDTTTEFRAHIVMDSSFSVLGGFLR